MLEKLHETVKSLKNKGVTAPEIGIVLGTGLGRFVDSIAIDCTIDYTDIPHFPVSTVESHSGKLIYGTLHGKKILAMQGRFHYYEGYSMQEVTFPVRVMKLLGVNTLFLSNAAGAMNPGFRKGSLMLIDDHINLLPESPLRGKNIDELGPRFPDMSEPYSKKINQLIAETAEQENIHLNKGVYVAVQGPNLETRAEYRFLHKIGADVVGMSTVPEVIVANHAGLPCAAISVLTDECDPDNLQPVDIEEIIRVAGEAESKLIQLMSAVIKRI